MDSSIIKVYDILNAAKSLTSAGFSAGYSFDESKAASYFDELLVNSKYPTPIFSGILIIENKQKRYKVIDGIQRLTTISLLLCALCESFKGSAKNADAKSKIYERFLITDDEPKLKLGDKDKGIYKKILTSENLTQKDLNSNVYQTYKSFLDKIKEHKLSGNKLLDIISKVQFMTIFIDKSEISARELYQTLNNNKSESQINLIYDFISQQDSESGENFLKIGTLFKDEAYFFECFLRDFLITRIDSENHNRGALYTNFKNYYYSVYKYIDMNNIVSGMEKYAKYYLRIINADFDVNEIKEQLSILNDSEGKDTYPYLMEVLDDLENKHIDMDAFLNILMMVNLFVKGRQDIAISNVNIDFSSLSKELNKMLVLKDYVPEFLYENKLTINEINKLSKFEV